VFNLRGKTPCRSPEENGAEGAQSGAGKPDKSTAHVRPSYPVKAPEGRVTRRAEPALPHRRMPGTDKQVSNGNIPVQPAAASDTVTDLTDKPTATPPPAAPAPAPAPAAQARTISTPAAPRQRTPEEIAAAKEAAILAARQAARQAPKVDEIATRPTERTTRESIQARQSIPITEKVGPKSSDSGPLKPFSRGVKASEAPTMPPHRVAPSSPVQHIPKPPAQTQPAKPMTVPKSDAFAPARPAIPTVSMTPPGEETELRGNVAPVRAPATSSGPISPLEETQDMDPAEVERPPLINGEESPRISFGQAALNLKLVTAAQIQECVNIQRMQMTKGQRVTLLGQILLERGYLDKAGIDRVKSYQQVFQFGNKIPGYQIVEKLGQGAMGAVFKAKQLRMERFVAIKVLQPELAANPTIKARFLQEARASARLNHPNVIVGIDAGEVGGLSYFAMEYVEGKTLHQLVKERGPMDERQALEVIVQVSKALEHAEKHSLVHRDIKPDNIMVTRERVAKLLDLGLAKMRVEGDVGQSKGMAVGTPNYISPEQAMGRSDIDTRADIYSLGVTLFFVLTGRVPFEGPPEVVMYRHIHEPPPHPKNFRPDLSDSVCTLMFTMMAKRPEDRPASAGQVVSDIEHLLRTGKLPGLFDSGAPAAPLRVNKSGGALVVKKRLPNLHGYGMPGAHTNLPPSPPPSDDANAPRLPRKRRKHFGSGW